MNTKVWLVQGVNPVVPGMATVICKTKERADVEASRLLNIMLKDMRSETQSTAQDWEDIVAEFEDELQDQECGVWVEEYEVLP